jgi:hypothetical protein
MPAKAAGVHRLVARGDADRRHAASGADGLRPLETGGRADPARFDPGYIESSLGVSSDRMPFRVSTEKGVRRLSGRSNMNRAEPKYRPDRGFRLDLPSGACRCA